MLRNCFVNIELCLNDKQDDIPRAILGVWCSVHDMMQSFLQHTPLLDNPDDNSLELTTFSELMTETYNYR